MKNALLYYIIFISLLYSLPASAQIWVPVGSPGFSPAYIQTTSIAIDTGGIPYLVFVDSGKATVMKCTGGIWSFVGSRQFSDSTVSSPKIAIDGNNIPFVIYSDYYNSLKATVKKFDGTSWVTVGMEGFSAYEAVTPSIAIAPDGTTYVVYMDGAGGGATSMKYNGTDWVLVGSAWFSGGMALSPSIAIDSLGTPYVVYSDFNAAGAARVMKFNGTTWVSAGTGFPYRKAQYTSIAIDMHGTPYVVFEDWVDSALAIAGKTTVMKYNGSNWVFVGSPGFSTEYAAFTSIAIDAGGIPYVSYINYGGFSPVIVKKFIGSSWVSVGGPTVSTSPAWCPDLAMDRSGNPYVSFSDGSYGGKATVMRVDTILSPITGANQLCAGNTILLNEVKTGGFWSSSNAVIASVDTIGSVTGLSAGIVTISYTKSGFSATKTVTVNSIPVGGTLLAYVDSICPGTSTDIYNSVTGGIWLSLDNSIATVIADPHYTNPSIGLLTGISSGTVNLEYILTNSCGTDTTHYTFIISSSSDCINSTFNTISPRDGSIEVFPNPAFNTLTITSNNPITSADITNYIGQTFSSQKYCSQQVQIDVANLPSGIYLIRINGTEVRKFLKE